MIYELREYLAYDHTLEALHDRFRTTTLPLFAKHGLDVVGFWNDETDPTRLIYLLRFADEDAKARAWSGFQSDPEWKAAKAESETDGPITASMSSRVLAPVDYWPAP